MSDKCQPFSGRMIGEQAFELGEGPTYDPQTGTAWWFDILGMKLVEWEMASDRVRMHDLPEMASVLAIVDGDRQIIATETGLCLRERRTGVMRRYLAIEDDNPATRSNDGRVHPCGALWIGTMGKAAEPGAGTIYHVFRGECRPLFGSISIPNAICFSPDGATAYYADTPTGLWMRVAVDPETALPAGEPAIFYDHRAGQGGLDGAVVDAAGNLWNARWGAGCVDVYSQDGRRIASHAVPATQTSCPAFVGEEADAVLVTTAREGMDSAALADDPKAGHTFLLGVTADGRHEPRMVL